MTAPPVADAIASFTETAAFAALRCALAQSGIHGVHDMRLLQDPADNAVVHVPELEVVARIAASEHHYVRMGKELTFAAWIACRGIPTVEPASRPPTPQLTVVDDRVITWWTYLPSMGTATYAAHGAILARLHQVSVPPFLPRLDPWARTSDQISLAARVLPAHDIDVLLRERRRLDQQWQASLWPNAEATVVHGDPYIGNTLTATDGIAHLVDFEDAALGPLAWDLASILGAHRLGWVNEADWAAFCDGYGTDPAVLPDINIMVDVLAFRRACWLASTASRNTNVVKRARHRIATLHLPLEERNW